MKKFLGGVGCSASVVLFVWFISNAPIPAGTPGWLVVAGLIGIFATVGVFLGSLALAVKS